MTPMLQSEQSGARAELADGQRYAVWLGALVTGFCTYGAACWITQLSVTEMRLMLAGPAVLSPDRLKPGRKIVIHISHRTGETWRILPIRAAIIGAEGNFFTAHLLEPGPTVIEGLLRALIAEGRAKLRPATAGLAQVRPSSPTQATSPAAPPARSIPSHLVGPASRCRAIALDLGAKWAVALMDGLDSLLFARLSNESDKTLQHQLDECYLSFVMAREKLGTEVASCLATQVENAFDPSVYGSPGDPNAPMGAKVDLAETIGLKEALDSSDVGSLLRQTRAYEQMRRWEERLAQLIDAPVTETNDPIGIDAICATAAGTILRHWTSGATVRTFINDALTETSVTLSAFYDGLTAGLDDTDKTSQS